MAAKTEVSTLKHDPWLTPTGPAPSTLADGVFADLERLRPAGSRAPRTDALERRREVVRNIVANLAECLLLHGPTARLAIAMGQAIVTRYDRPGLPPQVVSRTVLALERAGYVFRYPGSRGNSVTTLELAEPLLALIARHGVTLDDVGRVPGAETILLKAPDPERPSLKRLVEYSDTPKTRRMRAEVERINSFINGGQRVTIDGRPLRHVHLARQFLIPSPDAPQRFDAHGRLYGGEWINLPKEDRSSIRIDGHPLADLDFSAMLTRLAYAKAGASQPDGDPYAGLPGLEQPSEEQRQAIKRGLSALYFRTGPMVRLPDEVKAGLGPGWTAKRFMAAVAERHAPIAGLFGKGIGLLLFYIESNIMVRTLLTLMDHGVVALPIHDGLLCSTSSIPLALDAMAEASLAIVGVALPVTVRLPTNSSLYGQVGPPIVARAEGQQHLAPSVHGEDDSLASPTTTLGCQSGCLPEARPLKPRPEVAHLSRGPP